MPFTRHPQLSEPDRIPVATCHTLSLSLVGHLHGASMQGNCGTSDRQIRSIGEPQVGQQFIAFVGLLRSGKRLAADIAGNVVVTVGEMYDLTGGFVFSCVDIKARRLDN